MKNFIVILLILLSGDSGSIAQPTKREADSSTAETKEKEMPIVTVDTAMYNKPDPGNQRLKAAGLEVKIIKLEAIQTKKEAVELKETLEGSPKTVREVKREIRKQEKEEKKN